MNNNPIETKKALPTRHQRAFHDTGVIMEQINSNSNHGSFIKKPATGKLYFAVPTQDELKVAQAHASFQNFMSGLRKALSVGALTVAAVVVSFGALKGCADDVERSAVVGEAQ